MENVPNQKRTSVSGVPFDPRQLDQVSGGQARSTVPTGCGLGPLRCPTMARSGPLRYQRAPAALVPSAAARGHPQQER